MSSKISQEVMDLIAKGEAESLLEGLNDPLLRNNPMFLSRVRAFLKDNGMVTAIEREKPKSFASLQDIPDVLENLLKEDA